MNSWLKPGLILAFCLSPSLGWSLSTDRDQPMLIEADRAELNDAEGVSIYHGNVKVTQGTLVLTGETMTVHSKGDNVDKVVIEGKPATYKQRPDNKDKDVRAKALRMEYTTDPEYIILQQQAEVDQEGDTLHSERIEYDVARDKVNAGTDKPSDRVRIIIQPRADKKTAPAP
ncbi:hypothetical protein MNBD_GAMMA13-166 [hydrothermal vent metagenome]|uniref:Organic solvent tolerance-like N-terminal domain-containing protein n=1 Tax=hydrothermal vent metagenome TaxID=652676 RepID=A0A3B0YPC9_9ZZZZ